MIKFSCIITVYSGTVLEFFREAITSIVNQTVQPNEIIIVLDGPVQKEVDLFIDNFIVSTNPLSIRKIALAYNVGAGPARNVAIENAQFDWIAVMDCDDYSIETRFEKQIDVISRSPDVDFVCSLSDEFTENFELTNFSATKKCPEHSAAIKKRLNYNCCITNPTILFKRKVWEQANGYDSIRFLNEDHFFFLKIAKQNFKFYCIQEALIKVRIGKEQRKRRQGLKLFITDINFRYDCFKKGLIDFKGLLILIPLFVRRFTPSFILPYIHKVWRAI